MTNVAQERIDALRQLIARENAVAYLAYDPIDIAYFTAFEDVFDSEWAHALLVTATTAVLHTDSRYLAACQREAKRQGGIITVDGTVCSHGEFVAKQGAFGQISVDDGITLKTYRALEKEVPATMIIVTKEVGLRFRARKDAGEIACLQKAQQITDAAFAAIVDYISREMSAGIPLTERQVARALENQMYDRGAEALSFATIVASGENSANPHAIASDRQLTWGDSVVIDFGCKAAGYCSDMTRTVFLGEPSEQMQRAYAAICAANEAVEAALRPGVTGKEMHDLAESILAEHGFAGAMGHGLGHGVGMQVHELPTLNTRYDKPLEVGNVVTVEPGIYLAEGHALLDEGQAPFGMRLEDFGVLTEEGFSKFTQTSHAPVIIERD